LKRAPDLTGQSVFKKRFGQPERFFRKKGAMTAGLFPFRRLPLLAL
jgi:hypothetical protein